LSRHSPASPSAGRPFGSHDFLADTPFDANEFDRESGGFHPRLARLKAFARRLNFLTIRGLRRIRFHECRHTYASLLLQNGESPTYVKEQLGHSSIKITVDIYGHLVPGANRQAVNRLPSLAGFQAAERNAKEG
jgi:integrase